MRKDVLLAAAVALLVHGFLQFSFESLAGSDGFYHVKISEVYRERGLLFEFPWMYHSIMNEHFVDPHLLFHVCIIPFTYGDLILGGKAAVVLFNTISAVVFYLVLKRLNRAYPFAWFLCYLLGSAFFLQKAQYLRAVILFQSILFVSLYLIVRKRNWHVFALSWISVYFYGSFVFIPFFAFVHFLAEFLYSRKRLADVQDCLMPFLVSVAGMAAGLVANPYFPHNLRLYYVEFIVNQFVNPLGLLIQEWAPFSPGAFAGAAGFHLVLSLIAIPYMMRKRDKGTVYFFALLVLLTIGLVRSRRMLEYFVPVAVLFYSSMGRTGRRALPAAAAVAVIGLFLFSFQSTLASLRASSHMGETEGCMGWLSANTPQGSIVMSWWHEFPSMYFYNQHNYYIVGLNPNWLYAFDAQSYGLYSSVIFNKIHSVGDAMVYFNSQQFLLRKGAVLPDEKYLYARLKTDPGFRTAYEDNGCVVFSVKYK
ncbi:MAG: hypothetical protein ABH879_04710 [archaeon]